MHPMYNKNIEVNAQDPSFVFHEHSRHWSQDKRSKERKVLFWWEL